MLTIEAITEDNFYKVINLKVADSQSKYVAAVQKSLAECWLYYEDGDVFPFSITYNKEPIGFVMFEVDEEVFIIWRILIDERFQNKGYGKEVIELIKDIAISDMNFEKIIADYVIGNEQMKNILEKCGFKQSRIREDINEIETIFNLVEERKSRNI